MFGTLKKKMAVLAVVATGAVAAPAMASADTAIPPLQSGDTQAFASLTSGGPVITAPTTRIFAGNVVLTPVGSTFTITCRVRASVTINTDGTTRVPAITFTNCVTNRPNCSVSATATAGSLTPLGWGDRLVRDSAGVFRDRINAAFTNTLTNVVAGACPAPNGSYAYTGILSPRLTGGAAGTANATFDGAAAGTVTSALGPATATGSLVLEAGQSPIFFRV